MVTYTVAAGGERIDRVAKAIYGSERNGTVEALLAANPGLAVYGVMLPAGTAIDVPLAVDAAPATTYVLAWE